MVTKQIRTLVTRLEARRVAPELRANWTQRRRVETSDATFAGRLVRDREVIVPWLAAQAPLTGQRIVEVGCGPGASTVALAEQGADVTSIDVAETSVQRAAAAVSAHGLHADFRVGNAADLAAMFEPYSQEWVIFWASLEHMTISERLDALAGAWKILGPGGRLTLIETPNRLWYEDTHTSKLPFYHWLPDELAFPLSRMSMRAGFGGDFYETSGHGIEHFQRRGRGVSFHEFEASIGDVWHTVDSSLHEHQRSRSLSRRAGFRVSRHGRYVRLLQAAAPDVPVGFLEPFLYLTIVRQ